MLIYKAAFNCIGSAHNEGPEHYTINVTDVLLGYHMLRVPVKCPDSYNCIHRLALH